MGRPCTFIVRFINARSGSVRIQVEHVRSGAKEVLSSTNDLLAFMEQMNASDSVGSEPLEPARPAGHVRPARRRTRGSAPGDTAPPS
jgi:hypothetical protein